MVLRATDESYSLAILNLSAAAELTIGVVVGSLPIMPKFIQHVSAKISSKFAIKSGHEPEINTNAPKINALANVKRSFAKYNAASVITESWTDPYRSRAETHGEYLTLTEFDTSSQQAMQSMEPRSLGGGTGKRREDLEYEPDKA